MRTFIAVLFGVFAYIGCMLTGWFNGPISALVASAVFIFVSVFRLVKKKPVPADLDNVEEEQ